MATDVTLNVKRKPLTISYDSFYVLQFNKDVAIEWRHHVCASLKYRLLANYKKNNVDDVMLIQQCAIRCQHSLWISAPCSAPRHQLNGDGIRYAYIFLSVATMSSKTHWANVWVTCHPRRKYNAIMTLKRRLRVAVFLTTRRKMSKPHSSSPYREMSRCIHEIFQIRTSLTPPRTESSLWKHGGWGGWGWGGVGWEVGVALNQHLLDTHYLFKG